MSENQINPNGNNNQVGHTGDVVSDLKGANYANLRRAIADGFSDANARNFNPKNTSQSVFQDRRNEMEMQRNSSARRAGNYKRTGNSIADFETGLKDAMLDAIQGDDFKKGMNQALAEFTKQFGLELKDLPHELGKHFGKQLMDSQLGTHFKKEVSKLGDRFLKTLFNSSDSDQRAASQALSKVFRSFFNNSGSIAGQASSAAQNASQNATRNAVQNAANASQHSMSSSEIAGLAKAVQGIVPVAALLAVFLVAMKPLLEGLGDFLKAFTSGFIRDEDIRKKRVENARQRMEADLEYLAKEPFEILTNAAKQWEQTWDANLAKVSLTQGYTKENTYALYSSIAERLKNDKTWSGDASLSSVIAATDVINNLSAVLDTGLSGAVAEEFAYQATKLNAAIPTENFIGYASTYAQLAADAISRGKSEEEALAYANEELKLFASNLLYSSRTLSGGFSTGLKNAESLFKDAVDIAQTAKTSNVAQISGTLTAVSGVVGAIAPDLAQSLVQNVVSAAIGGNNDSIVALRSLAGINASNTEFLRRFANDPQGVFVSLFQNLANLQNMSPDNYMEVAEGLSSVFGVDMKALARVDFNQLAQSIANMNISYDSLVENLTLLRQGEATMSTEQLKVQEINNLIAEESLAYAIDSEAGRMVQQHMWDEQMKNALMENEYAVNLQGSALTLLEGLRHAVANILNFLNPIGFIANGVANVLATDKERKDKSSEIAQILQLGAVGGNQKVLDNLLNVSGNADLQLVRPLVEMMGGVSAAAYDRSWVSKAEQIGSLQYNEFDTLLALANNAGIDTGSAGKIVDFTHYIANPISYAIAKRTGKVGEPVYSGASWGRAIDSIGGYQALDPEFLGLASATASSSGLSSAVSRYKGFSTGKNALARSSSYVTLPAVVRQAATATEAAAAKTSAKWQEFINSAEAASETMSADAWLATAKNYGLDLSDLSDVGLTEEQLRGHFEAYQSGQAGVAEQKRKEDEQLFRDESRQFYNDTRLALSSIQLRVDEISEKIGDNSEYTVISVLGLIYTNMQNTFVKSTSAFQKCLADWIRYMAEVKSYQNSIGASQAWSDLVQAEGAAQQETLLALANAMQVFSADELKKLDPQLQANVLLGQIVVILQTMMQQNSTVAGGISLPETLSALGFGMTFRNGT